MLKRISAILLVGCLSMLFGEVMAGSSRAWFLDPWGLLLTLPLYLGHVLLLVWVAFRTKRVSLVSLYFLGIIFALYEAALTKVLWAGYWDVTDKGFGKFAGLSMLEYPILVFFWHPVMSFIMPVVAFQWMTGVPMISNHSRLLSVNYCKRALFCLLALTMPAFLASGSGYDPLSANTAILGNVLICASLAFFARGSELNSLVFSASGSRILFVLLIITYAGWLFFVYPERLPTEPVAYLSVAATYLVAGYLFLGVAPKEWVTKPQNMMSLRFVLLLIALYVGAMNFWIQRPDWATLVFSTLYMTLYGAGILFFCWLVFAYLKNSLASKRFP